MLDEDVERKDFVESKVDLVLSLHYDPLVSCFRQYCFTQRDSFGIRLDCFQKKTTNYHVLCGMSICI